MVLQERLEKIWISLKMPEALRVDMAMKYSAKQEIEDITEVIIFTLLPYHLDLDLNLIAEIIPSKQIHVQIQQ